MQTKVFMLHPRHTIRQNPAILHRKDGKIHPSLLKSATDVHGNEAQVSKSASAKLTTKMFVILQSFRDKNNSDDAT